MNLASTEFIRGQFQVEKLLMLFSLSRERREREMFLLCDLIEEFRRCECLLKRGEAGRRRALKTGLSFTPSMIKAITTVQNSYFLEFYLSSLFRLSPKSKHGLSTIICRVDIVILQVLLLK